MCHGRVRVHADSGAQLNLELYLRAARGFPAAVRRLANHARNVPIFGLSSIVGSRSQSLRTIRPISESTAFIISDASRSVFSL